MEFPSGKNRIGYALINADSRFFVSPHSNITIAFECATNELVDLAVKKGKQAVQELNGRPFVDRLRFVDRLAELVQLHRKELLRLFCLESNLPIARAENELNRSLLQFKHFRDFALQGYHLQATIDEGDERRVPARPDLRKMNVPLGVVAVFGASNFPFAYSTLGGDVASALCSGCAVVVKAHPMHPATSALSAEILSKALEETQMPDGLFSHLLDDGIEIGSLLVSHPKTDAVGFTGSIAGGKALIQLSNQRERPIPVFAEMGSVNPVVITLNALQSRGEEIAQLLAQSIALNAGQFCTSPGVVFVPNDSLSQLFEEHLTNELKKVSAQPMLHQRIRDGYERQLSEARKNTTAVLNTEIDGLAITPSIHRVSASVFMSHRNLQQEVFGSSVLLVSVETDDELLKVIDQLDGQLTGSLFFETRDRIQEIMAVLQQKVGRIVVNGVPTGVEVVLSQQHGGPFPSSSQPQSTAVGASALLRWVRPVAFQNCPDEWLPLPLKNDNSLGILRFVNGKLISQ